MATSVKFQLRGSYITPWLLPLPEIYSNAPPTLQKTRAQYELQPLRTGKVTVSAAAVSGWGFLGSC